MDDDGGCLLLLTADPVAVRGAEKAAREHGLTVAAGRDSPDRVTVLVIDLEQPGAIDEVEDLRRRHPDAFLAGHVSRPDSERWIQAERAGCDLVANRGALGRQLRRRLAEGSAERHRFPLVAGADVAGRLGLVVSVDDTPFGPVALYQVDGTLSVIEDVCPHAGARLSEGPVDGCVVTCPRHGSQFDVRTGARLRGPSDREVAVHEIVTDSGRVQLVWS